MVVLCEVVEMISVDLRYHSLYDKKCEYDLREYIQKGE